MRLRTILPLLLLLLMVGGASAQDEARLLRFPAMHGNQIVFTYAGDLYTVPANGGVARRLTSHDGFEMFPRFSPDGQWLAFTGQYDGNTEVYLMPAEGGVPKRLTYTATLGRDDVADRMGPNNIVMGWTPDGQHIIFRSRMRSFNPFIGELLLVSKDGGLPEKIPLPHGGFCSYSPDGSKLAYNRVFREFRTWKRYRGGMADDIWVYDFKTKKIDQISKTPDQEIIPMWHGEKIYFLSDRDDHKRMNLWVYDTKTKQTRQLTHYTDFDIKFPSLGDKAIVYEHGGYIYRFDLDKEKAVKVPVRILDDQVSGRGGIVKVDKNVTSYDLSPDGKRAVFGARGEVFTVPAQTGPTRNLTQTSGVHERNAVWSPDGKYIAVVSDQSGEDEIHLIPQDGNGTPRQLTSGGDTYKYEILWSPDSKSILWSDRQHRLQYVDVTSKKVTQVAHSPMWEITEFSWSPDSKWIAYTMPEVETMDRVYLYSVEQNKSFPVTDGWYDSGKPTFSGDGKYLFFVSDRDFTPIYSRTEWNHAYTDMARIYLVTLAKDTPSPFQPKSDETAAEAQAEDKKEETQKDATLKVDVDGLSNRILSLPIQPASYRNLAWGGNVLYYVRTSSKDPKPTLLMFDLDQQKETSLGNVRGFVIAAGGKKMLVSREGNSYAIIDLPKSTVDPKETLNLSQLEVKLDRQAEWRQIFHESWRQMRDFFYIPNMHGVDWPGMRKKYEPLLAHVNHRNDLTYIIGELIGELNVGHAYVGGGDRPQPERIQMGLLGAELRRDPQTGYYQIVKILKGANWDKKLRSPLTEVGVNVNEKDYITAVHGQPSNELTNIYEALVNTAGKQVTLSVNAKPQAAGSRDVVVVPIEDESELYYYNWVQHNIEKVDKATGGKVGYLHVPDMLSTGLNEFVKHFYPQVRKKALIIDVRGNGGGNVSPMLIERLRREIAMINIARNSVPYTNPSAMIHGPMVCLMNEYSASDGDLFSYQFKHYKLGKLIGKRSWGGVVGIRGTLPLLDGGSINRPEFSRYDVEGKEWVIEGYGVDPDIIIDNDPAREFAGEDQQLDKAIAVILEELKTKEKTIPPLPPLPKK
ncbi:MAG: S41 family peptidase [Gemmataceae bacterium]